MLWRYKHKDKNIPVKSTLGVMVVIYELPQFSKQKCTMKMETADSYEMLVYHLQDYLASHTKTTIWSVMAKETLGVFGTIRNEKQWQSLLVVSWEGEEMKRRFDMYRVKVRWCLVAVVVWLAWAGTGEGTLCLVWNHLCHWSCWREGRGGVLIFQLFPWLCSDGSCLCWLWFLFCQTQCCVWLLQNM
jgi:hypothetical protein